MEIVIEINKLYETDGTAKIVACPEYVEKAVKMAGNGNDIVLTGPGPVWLYMIIAHALHGKARTLTYDSPVTGKVSVFNHAC
ncbi:MAG TPA: CRISPR-associated protein Csx3 [bacterium]|mgnify:CR=1 FL=1|nr:CRISPR-associated protein Csx3 [bacterium]